MAVMCYSCRHESKIFFSLEYIHLNIDIFIFFLRVGGLCILDIFSSIDSTDLYSTRKHKDFICKIRQIDAGADKEAKDRPVWPKSFFFLVLCHISNSGTCFEEKQ